MKSRLQDMSDSLKGINDTVDSLLITVMEMQEDMESLEAKGTSSTERISAHAISTTATAIDMRVKDAMQHLEELAVALGHDIDTDFNSH